MCCCPVIFTISCSLISSSFSLSFFVFGLRYHSRFIAAAPLFNSSHPISCFCIPFFPPHPFPFLIDTFFLFFSCICMHSERAGILQFIFRDDYLILAVGRLQSNGIAIHDVRKTRSPALESLNFRILVAVESVAGMRNESIYLSKRVAHEENKTNSASRACAM